MQWLRKPRDRYWMIVAVEAVSNVYDYIFSNTADTMAMTLENVDSIKKPCCCGLYVFAVDWKDHQEVCVQRRLVCPAFSAWKSIGYIRGITDEELDITPDTNMPRSLRSLALEQVVNFLQDAKSQTGSFIPSDYLPDLIVKSIANVCPTFRNLGELFEHMETVCPHYKVKCIGCNIRGSRRLGNESSFDRLNGMFSECHSKWTNRSERYGHHAKQRDLDPFYVSISPMPLIHNYYCSRCSRYFTSETTHHFCDTYEFVLPDGDISHPSTSTSASAVVIAADPVLCFKCKSPLPAASQLDSHTRAGACSNSTCVRQHSDLISAGRKRIPALYPHRCLACDQYFAREGQQHGCMPATLEDIERGILALEVEADAADSGNGGDRDSSPATVVCHGCKNPLPVGSVLDSHARSGICGREDCDGKQFLVMPKPSKRSPIWRQALARERKRVITEVENAGFE